MHVFTENMDRHLYLEILNNHLYPNANNVYGRQHWVFQHDNDPKHTSRDVCNDLEMKLRGRVLQWPSYSPDLNPIENIWAYFRRNVEKRVKGMVAQKKSVTQEVFIALVKEEWEKILDELILTNISSMP